jgi:hypothetical protein
MAKLKGKKVDELYEQGELSVKVVLNKDDADAKNDNNGKAEPIMLRDVISADEDQDYFGNAVIVDAGSIISFVVKSKGPVGYGYRIRTDAEPIVDRLYRCDPNAPMAALSDSVRRYQNTRTLIKVDDPRNLTKQVGMDQLAKRWGCRITSWNVHGYLHSDSTYYGVSRSERVVDSRPGVVVQGGPSGQEFETIDQINEDNPDTKTNGYLHLYFFVFSDAKAKQDYFQLYKDPKFAV